MALDIEEVVDGRVNGEESRRRRGRFEPLHLSLSSPHRLMGVFRTIVLSQALLMLCGKTELGGANVRSWRTCCIGFYKQLETFFLYLNMVRSKAVLPRI